MKRIFLSSPHMSDEGFEKQYIEEAFDKNFIAPAGENVDKFEKEVAQLVGTKYAVALSSGTSAIHLGLQALGVTKDDIVFVQNLTFSASANPVKYLNATPIFIDSEADSWNMDPEALKKAFKKYTPKAVIVVHLYGLPANMSEIISICNEHNVPILEDAAESLGTFYRGRQTGTLTDVGIFSFNGNKIITSSGGGMLVTNDEHIAHKVKFWSTQSKEPFPYYQHEEIGYNYRLSNVSAGIGRGQLKVLASRIAKKRQIFNYYVEHLADVPEIKFIKERVGEKANYWLSAAVIESEKVTPGTIIDELAKENIEARRVWKPMHLQPIFKSSDFVGGKNAECFFEKGICLPSDTKMTEADLERTVGIIKDLFSKV